MLLGQDEMNRRGHCTGRGRVRRLKRDRCQVRALPHHPMVWPPYAAWQPPQPLTIQLSACWLTRCEVGPLMPRYRASCAPRRCAPMMEASTTCTVKADGGVCNRYAAAPMISTSGTVP